MVRRKKRKQHLYHFTSGCALLDQVLGGGWCERRIINVVGDFSSNKTGLAIEAMTNFILKYPDSSHRVRYAEAERAFDPIYAQRLGLPIKRVEMSRDEVPLDVVEDWYEDITQFAKDCEYDSLYVLDSLDALSSRQEMKKEFGKGSFNDKARQVNELLRRTKGVLDDNRVTLIIISQIRERMEVGFGEKYLRAGGKGLDFYASQVLWLYKLKQIRSDRTFRGKKVSRPIGVNIRARCKKSKVGAPLRECNMPMYFSYGIDDVEAAIDFLKDTGFTTELSDIGLTGDAKRKVKHMGDDAYQNLRQQLNEIIPIAWAEVEALFTNTRNKYG